MSPAHSFQRPWPDVSAHDLPRLVTLLLAWTVQSSKRGEYVSHILGLPDDAQEVLMTLIQGVLAEVGGGDNDGGVCDDNGSGDASCAPAPAPQLSESFTDAVVDGVLAASANETRLSLVKVRPAEASAAFSTVSSPARGNALHAGDASSLESPRAIPTAAKRGRVSASPLKIAVSAARALRSAAQQSFPAADAPVPIVSFSIPSHVANGMIPMGLTQTETAAEVIALREEIRELRAELGRSRRLADAAGVGGGGEGACDDRARRAARAVTRLTDRATRGGAWTDEREDHDACSAPSASSGNGAFGGRGAAGGSDVDAAARAALTERAARAETALAAERSARAAEKTALAAAIAAARDEIATLRPSAERCARAETAVLRLRKRCEDAGEVRDALARAHAKTTADATRIAELEEKWGAEEKRGVALRAALEAERDAKVVACVEAGELAGALREAKANVEELRAACESLQEAVASARAGGAGGDAGAGSGSGGDDDFSGGGGGGGFGLGVFDADAVAEVARLRAQIAEMQVRLDADADAGACGQDGEGGGASSRLATALAERDDARRIRAAFEAKAATATSRAETRERERDKARAEADAATARARAAEGELNKVRCASAESASEAAALLEATIARAERSERAAAATLAAARADAEAELRGVREEAAAAAAAARGRANDAIAAVEAEKNDIVAAGRRALEGVRAEGAAAVEAALAAARAEAQGFAAAKARGLARCVRGTPPAL